MKKAILTILVLALLLSGCGQKMEADIPDKMSVDSEGYFEVAGTYSGPDGAKLYINGKNYGTLNDGDSFSEMFHLNEPEDQTFKVKIQKGSTTWEKMVSLDSSALKASIAAAEAEQEKEVEENNTPHENPFFNLEITERNVKSGSGSVIGVRGYVEYNSELLEQLKTDPIVATQFREYIKAVFENNKYNWFNVFFEDGKALKTTGGFVEYIKPDEEGAVSDIDSVLETLMFKENVYEVMED